MADSDRSERAEALLDKIFTPAWRQHEGGVAFPSAAGLDFARICVEHCYADAWAREGALDLKTRSLITLTALAALGSPEEIKLHVQGALSLGHAPDDPCGEIRRRAAVEVRQLGDQIVERFQRSLGNVSQ